MFARDCANETRGLVNERAGPSGSESSLPLTENESEESRLRDLMRRSRRQAIRPGGQANGKLRAAL